ncbi:ankyrin repeat domain-containing protein, chloroplastic [Trifolium pratense]|uniref:Uncharacterized protein n=1 Tax=Trifolium pratense TaxID=57577 RepID=A0ACB0JNJ3_TRIPR|nr:ankyrin repeat domain-containing protein, chloroplastic [Trifolium pratense]CAJ2646680.1 unnamed protein product [Trifolium pratense]
MFNLSTVVYNPQPNTLFFSPFPFFHSSLTPHKFQSLKFPTNSNLHNSLSLTHQDDDDDNYEEHVIGDCLVFEDGIFEEPIFPSDNLVDKKKTTPISKKKKKKPTTVIKSENLVPDKWREVQAELNITKKDRRKIAQEIEFNSKVLKKKRGLVALRDINMEEYKAYKEARLAQLNPIVLDKPPSFSFAEKDDDSEEELGDESGDDERAKPENPRWAVYGRGLEDVSEFLNSERYDPAANKTEGHPRLFTREERAMLSQKKADFEVATSDKWLPLHTFAASGESFLVETILKHGVDINATDKDGLSALYKAIIRRKHAITNYLLRNSANPHVQDNDGATLMHYAVQTASVPTIKVLMLYNVDINLPDNDGWTPLHLAVQTQRNDIVRLLLIKGADKTLKNKDGLTPLDLCLYSGQSAKTYELIKLLKQPPKRYRSRNARRMEG